MWTSVIIASGFIFLGCALVSIGTTDEIEAINQILKKELSVTFEAHHETDFAYIKYYNDEFYLVHLPITTEFHQLEKLKGKIEHVTKRHVKICNENFQYKIYFYEDE